MKARGKRPHLQARSRIRAPQPRVRLQGQPLRASLHNHWCVRQAPAPACTPAVHAHVAVRCALHGKGLGAGPHGTPILLSCMLGRPWPGLPAAVLSSCTQWCSLAGSQAVLRCAHSSAHAASDCWLKAAALTRCAAAATPGDGGNIEKLYVNFVDEPGRCPAKEKRPSITKCPTKQDGHFCPSKQPLWSAFRCAHDVA